MENITNRVYQKLTTCSRKKASSSWWITPSAQPQDQTAGRGIRGRLCTKKVSGTLHLVQKPCSAQVQGSRHLFCAKPTGTGRLLAGPARLFFHKRAEETVSLCQVPTCRTEPGALPSLRYGFPPGNSQPNSCEFGYTQLAPRDIKSCKTALP